MAASIPFQFKQLTIKFLVKFYTAILSTEAFHSLFNHLFHFFLYLKNKLSINLILLADDIVHVCAALCKRLPPLCDYFTVAEHFVSLIHKNVLPESCIFIYCSDKDISFGKLTKCFAKLELYLCILYELISLMMLVVNLTYRKTFKANIFIDIKNQ